VATYLDGITPPLLLTQRLSERPQPHTYNPDSARFEVAVLWRLGQIERARARLAPLKLSLSTAELRVALALEEPDGRPAARAAWDASLGSGDDGARLMALIPWLYLTGEPERVPVMAAKLRASGFRWRTAPVADWDIFLRFWEGKLSEAEFLNAPATNRMIASWRRWMVGMKRLGEGDRDGARQAFTAVVEARTFAQAEWEWCCSFLVRMNADREWPRAIPLKPER
jgi:hypothetical protein